MQHTKFGHTGLQVSRLCLGTMTFGLQCDEPRSHEILDAAAESGSDFLDTADVYPMGGGRATAGRTEEIIGNASSVQNEKSCGRSAAHMRYEPSITRTSRTTLPSLANAAR